MDRFDLSGTHRFDSIALIYGLFIPKTDTKKSPWIIWLHGKEKGGTDPSIPLIANKAIFYTTPKLQSFFKGAYILAPQTPTF